MRWPLGRRWLWGALAIGAIGLGSPPGAGGDPARRVLSLRPVVVEDAAGRRLGRVVGVQNPEHAFVWLRVAGKDFVVQFGPDGPTPVELLALPGVVVFEASDCSGPPLIIDFNQVVLGVSSLFDVAAVGPGGLLLGAGGPAVSTSIAAAWNNPNPGCNPVMLPPVLAAPTVTVLDPASLALPLRAR